MCEQCCHLKCITAVLAPDACCSACGFGRLSTASRIYDVTTIMHQALLCSTGRTALAASPASMGQWNVQSTRAESRHRHLVACTLFAMMNRGLVCRRIVEVYVAHSNFTTTQSSATPALVLTQGFALSDLWAVASVRLLPCRAVSQGMDGGAIQ